MVRGRSSRRHRNSVLGCVAALAGVLLAGCAVRADARAPAGLLRHTPSPQRYGVVTSILPESPHLRRVLELGVGWVRLDFYWNELEPERGVHPPERWQRLHSQVKQARAAGLSVYATLSGTPAWARIWACPYLVDDPAQQAGCRPADPTDWERFVERAIRTFGTDVVYGIWNEPNLGRFLIDAPGAQVYTQIFEYADRARARANPGAVLAGPETSHHALESGYFERAMASMRPFLAPTDIVTVHWYPDGPELDSYLARIRAIAAGHPVWLTETGANECDDRRYARVLESTLAAFDRSPVDKLFWYVLHHAPASCEALLRDDSAYTPRPPFTTFQNHIH